MGRPGHEMGPESGTPVVALYTKAAILAVATAGGCAGADLEHLRGASGVSGATQLGLERDNFANVLFG